VDGLVHCAWVIGASNFGDEIGVSLNLDFTFNVEVTKFAVLVEPGLAAYNLRFKAGGSVCEYFSATHDRSPCVLVDVLVISEIRCQAGLCRMCEWLGWGMLRG
jgi:hypothetical protein